MCVDYAGKTRSVVFKDCSRQINQLKQAMFVRLTCEEIVPLRITNSAQNRFANVIVV